MLVSSWRYLSWRWILRTVEANPAVNTSFVTGLASNPAASGIHWLDVEAACKKMEAAVHI